MSDPDKELHLALQRRNAILRAWKGHGLPVFIRPGGSLGQWVETPLGAVLRLGCELCYQAYLSKKKLTDPIRLVSIGRGARYPALDMGLEEARTVEWLQTLGCYHLDPMLAELPVEVQALVELELLAGSQS